MPSFNKVILVGNLTRDPEIRYTGSGKAVTKFAIAVNNTHNKDEEPLYADIVAWDKLAETCNTYLRKGMPVMVEGRLSIRSYDDKDGNKKKATEIVINNMQMLGGKRNGESSDNNSFAGVGAGGGRMDDLDEEIPFD